MTVPAGTLDLVRLALRRDRFMLPAWAAVFVALAVASGAATRELYASTAALARAATAMNHNTAVMALYGPVYDPTSLGAVAMLKAMGTGAAILGVVTIVLVVRHSRADEDAGRVELLGSGVVGRLAPITAAMAVGVGFSVVVGLTSAFGTAATGLPVDGSLVFGLAWAGVGSAFAGIAALSAQVARSGRAAIGVAVGVLGVGYLLRSLGDTVGPRWLSWLSPIGWGQQTRPFAGERWWVLLIPFAFAGAATAAAYALNGRRDLGAGLLPDKAGPSRAPRRLRSPSTLAWRLHRGVLAGWAVGFAAYGLVVGSVASTVDDLLNNDTARDVVSRIGREHAPADSVLAAMLGVLAVVAAAYGLQVVGRLRAEELAGRAETVLATPAGRLRWASGHVVVALGGSALLMAVAGLATGVSHAVAIDDASEIGRVLLGASAYIPAVWVVVGIAVLAFGYLPRLTSAGWVALVLFLLLSELGPLLRLDTWVLNLSPFAHVPSLSAGLTVRPELWLLGVASVLVVAASMGLRRRDVG